MSYLSLWTAIANYAAWYIFVFVAIMWLLVLLMNRDRFSHETGRKAGKLPMVSVLIPAHNEEESIEMTLKSVQALDYPKNLIEIIVIDDASTDNTRESIKRAGGATLLINKKNMGKARSLNRAIKIAKGEYIACIDADSTVDRGILKKMIGHFGDPEVACVTPALKVMKPRNFLEKIQAAEYLLNIFLRKSLDVIDSIHVTPGVFSVYRKSVLAEVGGFDENNLTEDMEIALRIHEAGYRITNSLDAISYTICPSTLGSLFKQRLRWYRGALQNTAKYKHMIFRRSYGNLGMFLLPFNFISIMAVITIFMLLFWNVIDTASKFVWQLSLIDWNLLAFFKTLEFDPQSLLLNTITTPFVFMLLGLLLGGYLLVKSFRITGEKVGLNKLGYVTYLVIYPLMMMSFWFTALAFELLRIKRKW
jgi:cellulose synthase/poly-beta-1,6-N-acetylglucosamine synthase-like glycosyltransferase